MDVEGQEGEGKGKAEQQAGGHFLSVRLVEHRGEQATVERHRREGRKEGAPGCLPSFHVTRK